MKRPNSSQKQTAIWAAQTSFAKNKTLPNSQRESGPNYCSMNVKQLCSSLPLPSPSASSPPLRSMLFLPLTAHASSRRSLPRRQCDPKLLRLI
jgi:hypothetical protein